MFLVSDTIIVATIAMFPYNTLVHSGDGLEDERSVPWTASGCRTLEPFRGHLRRPLQFLHRTSSSSTDYRFVSNRSLLDLQLSNLSVGASPRHTTVRELNSCIKVEARPAACDVLDKIKANGGKGPLSPTLDTVHGFMRSNSVHVVFNMLIFTGS